MHDVLRPLSQSERDEAVKLVYDYVISRLGDRYLWNLAEVIEAMVCFAISRDELDPSPVLNYWDRKVKVISEMVASYLVDEYHGIANFGMLERARRLHQLAQQ